MARLAIGVAGAAVGSFIGQPGLGFALGSMAGNYLFPEDLGTTEGPRLDDRSVISADEGTDKPIGWGTIPVAGQIIWADQIREKKTVTEEGGKGSATTSSYKEYSYTATFAVSFGAIVSEQIRRLWFNGEIVVDKRPGSTTAWKSGLNYAEYLGTATQEPDASIEAIVGTGNAPAYRGQTYIVFRDLPLAEFGNRIPSITAEILTAGTSTVNILDGYIWDDTASQLAPNMEYDYYNDVCYYSELDSNLNVDFIHKIDPYTGSVLQNFEGGALNQASLFKLYSFETGVNNRLLSIRPSQIKVWNTETGNLVLNGASGYAGSGILRITELENYMVWIVNNFGAAGVYYWEKSDTSASAVFVATPTGYTDHSSYTRMGLVGKDPYAAFCYLLRSSDSNPALSQFTPDGTTGVWGNIIDLTMPDSESGRQWQFRSSVYDTINGLLWTDVYSFHATNGDFYYWLAIDPSDGSIVHQITSGDRSMPPNVSSFFDVGTQSIYYYSSPTLSVNRLNVVTLELDSWVISWTGRSGLTVNGANTAWYHAPTNRVLMYGHESSTVNKSHMLRVRLESVTSTQVTVESIIEDVCERVGIPDTSLDTTALTETVTGYRVMRQSTGRSVLEPVLHAKQIDVVQSDYKLKFVPRGGASALTISADDLGSNEGDTSADLVIPEKIPQGIDLPRSFDLQYLSSDRDLQPGSVRAMWAAAGREREASRSLGLVMSDDDAVEMANIYLQEAHELREYEFSLPTPYAYLEPTDVITVPVTTTYNALVKLTQTNRSQSGIECRAIRVDSENLNTNVVGGGSVVPDAIIGSAGVPQVVVLDTNLLRDVDQDHPGPYLTAYTSAGGFLPAGVYVSTDGLSYVPQGTISSEPVVGLVPATPTTGIDWEDYDTTNTVVVTVIAGTAAFATVTDAQLLAGANVAAWGRPGRWEIVQWKTVTDNGDGTYDLDDLLRGRRGTNRNADLHEANDLFVVLDTSSTVRLVNTVAEIGNTIYYKVVPEGQPIGNYAPKTWTVGSNPLYPYCPIDVTGTDVGGAGTTLQIDWTRRTRRGGFYGGANSLTDQVEGTLSEDSEEYELDIYDSADLATVVRAVTALSSPTYDYTSAQWTADGFVSTDTIVVRIYQISATVDRGVQSDDETLTIP